VTVAPLTAALVSVLSQEVTLVAVPAVTDVGFATRSMLVLLAFAVIDVVRYYSLT